MRYEKIILGRIRCEKAPQVVRAWVVDVKGDRVVNKVTKMKFVLYFSFKAGI